MVDLWPQAPNRRAPAAGCGAGLSVGPPHRPRSPDDREASVAIILSLLGAVLVAYVAVWRQNYLRRPR